MTTQNPFLSVRRLLVAIALLAGVGVAVARFEKGAAGGEGPSPEPTPANPTSEPVELVSAQPFVLEEPYTHWWRKEQPDVHAGWILVVRADPALVEPRQTLEPVLYVGDETAERCNAGTGSSHLVVLVPSPVDATGQPTLDPEAVPIWFGDPALPETVDRQTIAEQRRIAEQAGVRAPRATRALAQGALLATLHARDRTDLDVFVADHIERHSPTEIDLAEGLRVPRTF